MKRRKNTAGLLSMTMGGNIPGHCMCYFVGPADEQTELDDELIAKNQVHELAEQLAQNSYDLAVKLTGKTKRYVAPKAEDTALAKT